MNTFKRLFDFFAASILLFILSPVFLLILILQLIFHGFPILFKQTRPGLMGQPFTMYKFRTMTNTNDSSGNLLPDKDRLTLFGRFLRSTSLDELPELFNVIKGNMSLVGPRPLLMKYLDLYTIEQARRHEVKPGITGWAQVNGRNALTWEDKFNFDVWYVENQSLWLDLKIIAKTIWKIIRREGITQTGEATAKEFQGTGNNG